jgi:hypothetical protein
MAAAFRAERREARVATTRDEPEPRPRDFSVWTVAIWSPEENTFTRAASFTAEGLALGARDDLIERGHPPDQVFVRKVTIETIAPTDRIP